MQNGANLKTDIYKNYVCLAVLITGILSCYYSLNIVDDNASEDRFCILDFNNFSNYFLAQSKYQGSLTKIIFDNINIRDTSTQLVML